MDSKQPLSVTHPELAKQAVGWDPDDFTAGSNKKVKWICSEGHIWQALISNRSRGRGCKICSKAVQSKSRLGKSVQKLLLIESHPEIAKEAVVSDGADLHKIKTKSGVQMHWTCPLGHDYVNSPNNRSSGQGCPFCSGKKVLVGFNDLATTHPDLAKQAFGWDPSGITYGVSKKVEWNCPEGHIWKAIVNLRSSQQTTCPVCDGRKVLVGFNDLQTTNPEIARQAYRWDPRTVTFGSNKKVKWICESGHKWSTTVESRTPRHNKDDSRVISSKGSGCPTCSPSGYDPNSDGWLYFLKHHKWDMLQIGITNNPEDRLKKHKKLGWELIELRGPMDGLLAREWETSILQMLKQHGAQLAVEEVAGKFDGYTEAWVEDSLSVNSLRELMGMVRKDEEG
jgi:Probable Zinc-ribbon domain